MTKKKMRKEKCTSLKSEFFSKKCITRAFFIFIITKNVKEVTKLSETMAI